MNQITKLAYLAPELPSLSATFVYNEIRAVEKQGVDVQPYSVHQPGAKALGIDEEAMAAETPVIYKKSKAQALAALITQMFAHPILFGRVLLMLMKDIFKVGFKKMNGLKLSFQFLYACWLAQDLRAKQIQHLHIHFAHVPTQIGMYAAELAGIQFTFMAHANDIFERPLLIPEKIMRSKQMVTISDYNINLIHERFAPNVQIGMVRCGVNSTNTSFESKENSQEPMLIGSIGRLVEKKGFDTLIDAAQLLKKQKVRFRMEIAGDGPLMNILKEKTEELQLTDQIHFLGALAHEDVLQWMSGLHAFALACKKDSNGDMDGIPVVLMEAMNGGIPVLSTKISGIPELVVHNQSGLLSKPGDASELADNIKLLVNDPELRSKLIVGAKGRITQEFDQKLNAQRLMTIINSH